MRPHPALKHRFAADVESLPLARILVRHWLSEGGAGQPWAEDVLFAASELCAHAVEASPGGSCQLDAWDQEGDVCLAVTSRPRPTAVREAKVHLAPGSTALAMLKLLCTEVEVGAPGDVAFARCSAPLPSVP